MKNIVRAFVVTLAISGSVAYTQINNEPAHTSIVPTRTSSMPVPMCPPDDPQACGIAGPKR